MIEAKRKYQPSLDPISEVFELEQLSIVRPVVREGSIRREGGLFVSWKDRIFVFLYVPQQSITCSVYKKNSECPEEVLDLA